MASVVRRLASDIPGGGGILCHSVLENVIKGHRAPDVRNITWK